MTLKADACNSICWSKSNFKIYLQNAEVSAQHAVD